MKSILQELFEKGYVHAIEETARLARKENISEKEVWERLGYKEKFGELRDVSEKPRS